MTDTPSEGLDPFELAALVCTRLCHDMAGPVGAVANGAELMGGDPAMVDAEALGLLTSSAAGAAVKLRTLRAAFGLAGAVEPGDLPRLLAAWGGPRCTVTLPPLDHLARLGPQELQLLLNLGLLALDTTVAPTALVVETAESPDGLMLSAVGTGRGPRLDPGMADAMAGTASDLGPRTVQGWVAGAAARRLSGTAIVVGSASGSSVSAVLPQR